MTWILRGRLADRNESDTFLVYLHTAGGTGPYFALAFHIVSNNILRLAVSGVFTKPFEEESNEEKKNDEEQR